MLPHGSSIVLSMLGSLLLLCCGLTAECKTRLLHVSPQPCAHKLTSPHALAGCRSPEAEKAVIQAKLLEAEAGLAEELGEAPAAHAADQPAAGVLHATYKKQLALAMC